MATKDHNHKKSPVVSALTGVLPPLCISFLALWFFSFLWEHSNSRMTYHASVYDDAKWKKSGVSEDGEWQKSSISEVAKQKKSDGNEDEKWKESNINEDPQWKESGLSEDARWKERNSNENVKWMNSDINIDAKLKGSSTNEDAKWKKFSAEMTMEGSHVNARCDLSFGKWVLDKKRREAYNESCRDIFKGWNCLRNNKSNAKDILAWRWQPQDCNLLPLNATVFLERFQNKRIGFVGDSLNRNMYVSLVCSLKQASSRVRKWRPVGADKAVTFLDYNLTLAYHRTNLLAHYVQWEAKRSSELESLGYKEGFRVDVDVPQSTWEEAPRFYDILVLNTGHWWWAPEKFDPVKTPLLFFEKGEPIIPTKSPQEGLDLVLKNMLAYIDNEMGPNTLKFLRTQSPRHFEGGDWNEGGKCHRHKPLGAEEANTFFSLEEHGPNVEMALANMHLAKSIEGTSFQLLNISYLSSLRADAHPSLSAGKLHEDCMHWCLPGVTDVWNDMFAWHLLQHTRIF